MARPRDVFRQGREVGEPAQKVYDPDQAGTLIKVNET